jgi:hypothetical protein
MLKYEESKTTRIMMATVRHVTTSSGLRKFQTDGFLFDSAIEWMLVSSGVERILEEAVLAEFKVESSTFLDRLEYGTPSPGEVVSGPIFENSSFRTSQKARGLSQLDW